MKDGELLSELEQTAKDFDTVARIADIINSHALREFAEESAKRIRELLAESNGE